jgi:hypothetical protein
MMRKLLDIWGPMFKNVYYKSSPPYLIHNVGRAGFAAYLQFGCCIKEAENEVPKMPVR